MVVMNILFAWTVNNRKHPTPIKVLKTPSKFNEKIARKTNSLVQKVVAILLICYTPYLINGNYYYIEVFPRDDVRMTPTEVN